MKLTVSRIALSVVISGIGSLYGSTDAIAQATSSTDRPNSVGSSSADTTDIIVTANRVESSISRTALAVTALQGTNLQASGITNPTELNNFVPNLSIDRATNGLQFTIRGVTSTDTTEKGDPSVAFLSDGVYIARRQATDASFFDVDRVEVLRGPQGTLYGRNTTAGVVNVISKRPADTFEGSLTGTYASFGTRQLTGVINTPLANGAALRLAVNYDYLDTYIRRAKPLPYNDDPARDSISARLSGKFALGSHIEIVLIGDFSRQYGNNQYGADTSNFYRLSSIVAAPANGRGSDPIVLNPSGDDARLTTYNPSVPNRTHSKSYGILADVTWGLSDLLTLNYLGSYRKFDQKDDGTLDFGEVVIGGVATGIHPLEGQKINPATYQQNSHELRLAYTGDKMHAQAGLYYFDEKNDINLSLLGFLSPTPGTEGYVYAFPLVAKAQSAAAFAQATYSILDNFRITGGIRYTRDKKSRVGAQGIHASLNEPVNFVASAANPVPDSLLDASVTFKQVTWKIGTEWDLGPSTLIYGTISTGYKAGGFNDGCASGPNCFTPTSENMLYYQPEKVKSYEAGVKTRVLNDAARLSLAYFHYDYTNQQLTQALNGPNGAPVSFTLNAGASKVDGVELESQISLDKRNRVDISATWTNARLTDYQATPTVNFAGFKLDRAPAYTVRIGYAHTVPLAGGAKMVLTARSAFSSEYFFLSNVLAAQFRQPSFTRTDLSIEYRAEKDRWFIQAFARNLENKVQIGSVGLPVGFPSLSGGVAQITAPRTIGGRVGFNF